MCDDFIRVWTSVRTVALDEGWAKPSPAQQPETRRRLRPLMCAEPLLNFAETLVIEHEIREVLKNGTAAGRADEVLGTPTTDTSNAFPQTGHELGSDPHRGSTKEEWQSGWPQKWLGVSLALSAFLSYRLLSIESGTFFPVVIAVVVASLFGPPLRGDRVCPRPHYRNLGAWGAVGSSHRRALRRWCLFVPHSACRPNTFFNFTFMHGRNLQATNLILVQTKRQRQQCSHVDQYTCEMQVARCCS